MSKSTEAKSNPTIIEIRKYALLRVIAFSLFGMGQWLSPSEDLDDSSPRTLFSNGFVLKFMQMVEP